MIVITGLGNPTKKYEKTRHNVGFDAVDYLSKEYGIPVKEKKYKALTGCGIINGHKVMLVKPQTFMNLSGESLREIIHFFGIDTEEELIVIYDDISLEPGQIRIRKKGSAGGHNGMKSIISCIGTQEFQRIKIGVGSKPQGWDLADFVLSFFQKQDRKEVDGAIENTAKAIGMMLDGETDQAMNAFNAKK